MCSYENAENVEIAFTREAMLRMMKTIRFMMMVIVITLMIIVMMLMTMKILMMLVNMFAAKEECYMYYINNC